MGIRLACLPWIVLGVVLLAGAGEAAGRGVDGRFERRTSENFVLYQDVDLDHRTGWRGSNQFEREVLASLEAAHGALRDLLGVDPRQRIVVTVYDPAVFDASFGGLTAFPVAGFYAGSIRVRGDTRLTAELARVLHHEYVHAALAAAAPSLGLPALVNEGLAEWFARRAMGLSMFSPGEWQLLARLSASGGWLPLASLLGPGFGGLDGRSAGVAYLESRAFVAHLVRHYGEDSLLAFWRTLVRSGSFDRALARAYGADLQQLEARLLAELAG